MVSIFLLALLSFHSAFASATCARVLNSSVEVSSKDSTDEFIAYLSALLTRETLTTEKLGKMIQSLENEVFENPFSDGRVFISHEFLVHYGGIQRYVDSSLVEHGRLLDFLKKEYAKRARTDQERNQIQILTRIPYLKMQFLPVVPQKFSIGDGKKKKQVQLTHEIEVMNTPVTQAQWVEIMGENPSEFSSGASSVLVRTQEGFVRMQPDHPVENVTWWSALVFANRLSERHGLRPAYDLSRVKWDSWSRAEDGSLSVDEGAVGIRLRGGQKAALSEYYQAEGYRLPTEAEQQFLLRAGGDLSQLEKHAWYNENSENSTHPVSSLDPVIVQGKEFYDLLGNVSEWGWNFHSSRLYGGVNPVGPKRGAERIVRSGNWDRSAKYLQIGFRAGINPDSKTNEMGFRLVRTLR